MTEGTISDSTEVYAHLRAYSETGEEVSSSRITYYGEKEGPAWTNERYEAVIPSSTVKSWFSNKGLLFRNHTITMEIVVWPYIDGSMDLTGMLSTGEYPVDTSDLWPPTFTSRPQITSVSPASGNSTTIAWSAATADNLEDASIQYRCYVSRTPDYDSAWQFAKTTGLSADVSEDIFLSYLGEDFEGECYFFISSCWVVEDEDGGVYISPDYATFTFESHRTIKYYNGSGWVECIPYYYDGSGWVECIPYYYDGTSWAECSH